MGKLAPVTHKELVQRLRKFGFQGPYSGGKHLFMIRGDCRLTIPNLHRSQIGVAFLVRLLRQAGITKDQWLKI
ncbi:MAG TPA: type II toxin-antitoxin system HicA family toxin [Sedimenticola sp.]|nr:type II toxin-antitoxin system HicA family toxin [Sedimenticola sp.]